MADRIIRIVIDSRGAESGSDKAKRALRNVNGEAERADKQLASLGRTLNVVKAGFYALVGSTVLRELGRVSDAAKNLNSQLLIVEGSVAKVTARHKQLVDMSLRTGTSLEANVDLYAKTARALEGTGISADKAARMAETVAKALTLAGADAGASAGAIRQLGQALASGAFRGDEFNSVAESAPPLMRMLAQSLNVPIGKLRELAAEGELTTQKLVTAFTDDRFTKPLDEDFEKLGDTFGRTAENIRTALIVVAGDFDRGSQASQSILNFSKFSSDDLNAIGEKAYEVGEDIRVAFGALSDVFRPMLEGWKAVNQAIYQDSGLLASSLTEQIAEALGILDDLANGARRGSLGLVKGAAATADLPLNILTGGKYTPLTNAANRMADSSDREWESSTLAGQYRQQVENRKNLLKLDRDRKAVAEDQKAIDAEVDAIIKETLGTKQAAASVDKESAAAAKKSADEMARRLKAAHDDIEAKSRELELARAIWEGDVERTQLKHELLDIEKVRSGLTQAELKILGPILDRQKEITEEVYKQARFAEIAADAKARLDPGALHDPDKDLADLKRGYEEAGRAGGRALRDESLLAAEAFGQAIGGKVGGIIKQLAGVLQGMKSGDFTGVDGPIGGLLTLFGGAKDGHRMTLGGGVLPGGGVMSGLPDLTGKGTFSKGMKEAFDNAAKPFKSVAKEISKSFGLDGAFTQQLGKAFGGAAVGTATSGVMKALGIKTSQTGAQIGGAIGGLTGLPGGEIIGSVLGGLLGGMLKKAKTGMATITSVDGDPTLSGNSNKRKQAAAGLAGSVQSGLSGIADALGAELGSFSVSIGMRDDKYRVNPAGTGKTKIKNGAVDFGSDAEGAMKFAIRDAIRDGALLGISAFSERVLKGNTDLDKALDIATKYEQVLDALGADANGITAAAKDFAETFQTLAKEMQKVGATTEELANVEKLYVLEREKAMQSLLAPLLDYQKSLSGEGSGVTALERMKAAQVDYEKAKTDFAAGKVDQSAVTGAGQQYFGLARDVLGTANAEFQSIRQQLISDSAGLLETARNAFNAGAPDKLVAMQETANTIATQAYQQQVIANQYLAAIQASLAGIAGKSGVAAGLKFVNGKLVAA